ncbi:hypothetical protein BDV98DRAFT_218616 [Pterulicium gracile]|uniref:Uncharacterized protein n=1 Tax=Pterulicium gracile TaxID=1884261 RepID=A0A5C3Q7K5_9AGAR|nr:hypothetical protein BDV98DRAFT_218616 [Pterula gracilis]
MTRRGRGSVILGKSATGVPFSSLLCVFTSSGARRKGSGGCLAFQLHRSDRVRIRRCRVNGCAKSAGRGDTLCMVCPEIRLLRLI